MRLRDSQELGPNPLTVTFRSLGEKGMSFFGLTQLGAQSAFNANLVSMQNYTCYSEESFRSAFEAASGGAATIGLDKVRVAPLGLACPAWQTAPRGRLPRAGCPRARVFASVWCRGCGGLLNSPSCAWCR